MKKPKVFYGYWIVVATFLFISVSQGCAFFVFSLFVKPLQAELGWGRGDIMAAFSMFILALGLAAPFIGRVVDRYGVKIVISAGAVVTGLGYVLVSQMNELWQFYLGYIIIGTGLAATGVVPSSTAVSNWFKRKRGMAIGIMSSGIGVGGFVSAPLIGGFFIPNFGWRASYFALAMFIWVVIIPLAWFVIKAKPADMGLFPDGVEAPEAGEATETSPSAPDGLTLRMALVTPAFWLIIISFLFGDFSHVGVIQSQVPYLQDIGFPVATAATALGGVGLGSAVGKFGFGWLCDKIQPKYAWTIGLIFQIVAIIVIMLTRPTSSQAMIWIYSITMGLGGGSWLPTSSMLTSTSFGLTDYGAIFGLVTLSIMIGSAAGPLTAGYMYDTMNTYHEAFIIFLALYVISIPAILILRRPKSI